MTKAGLVELVDDDRATLLGALLELAAHLQDGDDEATPAQLRARWRHVGLRPFHQEREVEPEAARRPQVGGTAAERGSA